MSVHPSPLLRRPAGRAPSRWGRGLGEVLLWAWAVLLLEWAGRGLVAERVDLKAFLLGGLVAVGLAAAGRAGALPATARVLRVLGLAVRRLLARLEPPSGVAFRLPATGPVHPDRVRIVPAIVLLLVVVASLLAGASTLEGLDLLRRHAPYVVFVAALLVPWTLFAVVMTLAVLFTRSTQGGAFRGLGAAALGLAWLAAVVLLFALPGWATLVVFVAAALPALLVVLRRPRGVYHLYRRDPEGGIRTVTVDGWLRGSLALVALALLAVAALAAGPRLGERVLPAGPYALTLGLGLSAAVAATWLVLRIGARVRRLLPAPATAPETPLVPTVWWPGGDGGARWVAVAQARGYRVVLGPRPPRGGFDLVVGRPDDPRRFVPAATATEDDDAVFFPLQRRFHVVKRRAFFRALRRLVKAIAGASRPSSGGYLFCPHAWPVPAVVQDGAGDGDDGTAAEAPVGGQLVGPPYAALFAPRLRQYAGGTLRALDLDVVWWDARVSWPTLRTVWRVLFETWDQGRHPALERHFVGIARASVTIQDPDEDDESWGDAPAGEAESGPLPLRARALVIRPDDGGSGVDAEAPAPSTRRPEPVLV